MDEVQKTTKANAIAKAKKIAWANLALNGASLVMQGALLAVGGALAQKGIATLGRSRSANASGVDNVVALRKVQQG